MITNERFFEEIDPLVSRFDKFVIGLSGGADSLCLTLLANEYAQLANKKLYVCFIDHKLRPESSIEILPIIDIIKSRNIEYKVLTWNHEEEIQGSIENKARIARYSLLYQYCKEVNSQVLMTAHHALDQWETFFMRLSRGSSLKGLASIRKVSKHKDLTLIRPMLNFDPTEIKETLEKRFGITNYVRDPSNDQSKFERVRWRKSYDAISKTYGLDLQNITKAITRLQQADSCLGSIASEYSNSLFDGTYLNIPEFRTLHPELKMRTLNNIINKVLNKEVIISYKLLLKVANAICEKDFTATNISGLILRRDRTKNVKIYKESRN